MIVVAIRTQRGAVLIIVVMAIALVPAAALFIRYSHGLGAAAAQDRRIDRELAYVLDAAETHARFLADRNDTCGGFVDMPQTDFGEHQYSAVFTHSPAQPLRLGIQLSAQHSAGPAATRQLSHIAYQPRITASLIADKDTWARTGEIADRSTAGELEVLADGSDRAYAILAFPASGGLLPGARVEQAQLKLFLSSGVLDLLSGVTSAEVAVHAIGTRWAETADWETKDGNNKNWRPLGGVEPLFAPDPITTIEMASVLQGMQSFDLTPQLRGWSERGETMYGVLLRTDTQGAELTFASREDEQRSRRPALEVTYACPCGQYCSLLMRKAYVDRFTPELDGGGARTCDPQKDFRGSHGQFRWDLHRWFESGDDDDACAGFADMAEDPDVPPDPGNYRLRLQEDTVSLQRAVDLDGADEVAVSFEYRREGFAFASDVLRVEIRNGGGWTQIGEIAGPGTDSEYQSFEAEIPAGLVSAFTEIRLATGGLSGAAFVYVDDVTVSFTGEVSPSLYAPVTADAHMREERVNDTDGMDDEMLVAGKAGKSYHGLIRVADTVLAPGILLDKAQLNVWVKDNALNVDATLRAYAVTEDWVEPEVTWNDREKNVLAWGTPGGSYFVPADPALVPEAALPKALEDDWLIVDITSIYQTWIEYPATNLGLVLLLDDGGEGRVVKFMSVQENDAELRPFIRVTAQ